jgi:hypothetical protein
MVGNRGDGRQEEGNAMGDNGATSTRLIMEIKSGVDATHYSIPLLKGWRSVLMYNLVNKD